MNIANASVTISFGDKEYEVKFPDNGQLMDIMAMRHRVAGGSDIYGSMKNSVDSTSRFTALTMDMVSTFTTLIPELKTTLTTKNKSLLDLDLMKTRELLDQYLEVYIPWYDAIMEVITAPKKEETSEAQG